MNEQMSVCPLTRFPRIGVNFRGLPFENPFRRPCLFIVTDFKTISRGASDFFDCGKNLGTHGAPHGAPMEPLQGATFEKSPPAPLLTYCGMLGINCTQISARKMNPGLMQHYFEWDSHGVDPLGLPLKIRSGAPAYLL